MISIREIRINELSDTIKIIIESDGILNYAGFADTDGFKEQTYLDLSTLIPVLVSGQYIFNITKANASLSNFNGVFFLKFGDDTTTMDNSKLGVAANLIDYADCLLLKTLKITTKGCGEINNDCEGCKGNASFVATLIEALNAAIMFGYLDEAVRIVETLDKTCNTCQGCPSQSELYLDGYGYGIINDNITLL
jgi:hypothetical protein